VNGYVIDPGDRAALLARMHALMDDSIAARMGKEAHRRYWNDPRTVDAHTGNLLTVYRTVLSTHRARAASKAS
jgi:hypothetical protein